MPIAMDREMLTHSCPHILRWTPGRVLRLLCEKDLKLDKLMHFVLDKYDKCLHKIDMRKDVQQLFIETPKKKPGHDVQCKHEFWCSGHWQKFMQDPHEIRVDEESKRDAKFLEIEKIAN